MLFWLQDILYLTLNAYAWDINNETETLNALHFFLSLSCYMPCLLVVCVSDHHESSSYFGH